MAKVTPTKRHGPATEIQDEPNVSLDQAFNENGRRTQVVMENMLQGVVMYNNARRVVIWNKQYADIFQYPKDFLNACLSNEDIIRYLITRGDYGDGNAKVLLQERIKIAWSGKAVQYEINVLGHKAYEVVSQPTDDGG